METQVPPAPSPCNSEMINSASAGLSGLHNAPHPPNSGSLILCDSVASVSLILGVRLQSDRLEGLDVHPAMSQTLKDPVTKQF